MNKIPQGISKMELVLTINNEHIEVWEQKILILLTRDYYIFYSKKPKFDGKQWTELHFYCRPEDETSLAYRMGHYSQVALGCYAKKQLDIQTHKVYDDFPNCIELNHLAVTQNN